MQTVTIELKNSNSLRALQDLEQRHLIGIVKTPDLNSYSLPGVPMGKDDFQKWVEFAEDSPTVSLNQAKQQWAAQKEKLKKLIS
jgi:hypothetical protein